MSEEHHLATLKNDDAEDSGEEGEDDNDEVHVKEARHIQSEKRTSEKQPTARIVGIIKRNWRAYVISRFMKVDCTLQTFTVTSVTLTALHSPHQTLPLFPNKPSLQHQFQGSFLALDYAPAKHLPLSVKKSLSPSIDGMSPRDTLRVTLCVHWAKWRAKRRNKRACCWSSRYRIGLLARQFWIACPNREPSGLCQ